LPFIVAKAVIVYSNRLHKNTDQCNKQIIIEFRLQIRNTRFSTDLARKSDEKLKYPVFKVHKRMFLPGKQLFA
jgi:hypothetical protein